MAKNRTLYLIGVTLAIAFLLGSWVWIAMFVLILTLLLPLFSLAASIIPMRHITYRITVPETAKRREKVNILISDSSSGFVPCYYIELEIFDPSGSSTRWTANMHNGEKRVITLSLDCSCLLKCRVRKAYVCDYLGLFRFRLPVLADQQVCIIPEPSKPDPLPDLSSFNHISYRPKYGGGFAEIHDMRDYRPGDSMRDIHWKLSAKTDRLIVREPQIPDTGCVLLTLNPVTPSAEMDSILDRLFWLSDWLCCHGIEHDVRWMSPDSGEVVSATVDDKETQRDMLLRLLDDSSEKSSPDISAMRFPAAAWRCHIASEEGRT